MTAAALARTTGAELRRAAGEARGAWSPAAWIAVAALALGVLVPFLGLPGLRMDALASTVYLAVAATGLGLTVGAAGLPSLGAGAFVAIGAFTSALLMARAGWPLEPAALCGALGALAVGLVSGGVVRLRPAFVAVSTWLLAWLVWLFLFAFPSVSGGSQGLIVPERTLLGLSATPTVHYEAALVLLALSLLAIGAVRRGAFGLELSALRQRPPLATSLGVPLARRRLGAFAASAAIAGLAGGLSVQLAAVADPAAYDPFLSFKLLVAVLLGGAVATLGPAVGVAALGLIGLVSDPLARLLQLPLQRFDTAVAAFLLVFVLALGGDGIIPWLSPWLPRFRRRSLQVTPRYEAGERAGTKSALKVEGLTNKADRLTFGELLEKHYLPWSAENKRRARDDQAMYRNWLKPHLADKSIKDVAPLDLERLKRAMREAGKSEATVKHALCLIRQAFNKAVVWRLWGGENPCKGVAFPTPNNARQRFLTQEEAGHLLEALRRRSPQIARIATVSLYGGLRLGEVLGLIWSNVDTANKIIYVQDTKNGSSRPLFVTGPIQAVLNELKTGSPDELLFPSKTGNPVQWLSKSFRAAVEDLKFNEGISDPRE